MPFAKAVLRRWRPSRSQPLVRPRRGGGLSRHGIAGLALFIACFPSQAAETLTPDQELAQRQGELERLAEKAAQFAETRRPVAFIDDDIIPRRSLRFADGALLLHPLAAAGLGYDSNPRKVESGAEDDMFAVVRMGLAFEYHLSAAGRLRGDAILVHRNYREVNDRDSTGGQSSLAWEHRGRSLFGGLQAGVGIGDEPQISADDPLRRIVITGDGFVGWRGATDRIQLGAGALGIDWRESGPNYDAQERDQHAISARVRWERRLGIGVLVTGTVLVADNRYRAGSRFQDSVMIAAHGGGALPTGRRSGFYAEVGIRAARYDDHFANDPAYDDREVTIPSGLLGWRWSPEPSSEFRCETSSHLEDGLTANAVWTWTTRVHAKARLRWDSHAYAELVHAVYRDSGSATGAATGKREVTELRHWIDWTFTRGLSLEGRAVYGLTDSVLGQDYDRLRISALLSAAW